MSVISARGIVGQVHEGRNGRLFLGEQDGFHLKLFAEGKTLDDTIILRWQRAFARRGRELAARGVPYVVFIVPDSPSVCPEDLPANLVTEVTPPGRRLLQAIGEIEGVTFVYPLQDLREAKGGLEVFKKKDSHWTSFGSFVGYQSLMRALEGKVAFTPVRAEDVQYSFRKAYGDLGSVADPEQSEEIPIPKIAGSGVSMIRQADGVGRQTCTESLREADGPICRAMFFRDSFMTDLAPYAARSFSHMLTIGSTTRVLLDAVDNWSPDIVINQIGERKLNFPETDHQLEGFESLYDVDYKTPEGKRLLEARIMLASDRGGAMSLIEGDLETLAANAPQAFSAAIIFEANGALDIADRLAQAAERARPEQAAYKALAGRVALACGRLKEAANLTGAAAQLYPRNGYFQELHAYCLMQEGEVAEALRVAEAALLHIDDHPNLYYWASVLHAAMRDTQSAKARILEAIHLDPMNRAYDAQLLSLSKAA